MLLVLFSPWKHEMSNFIFSYLCSTMQQPKTRITDQLRMKRISSSRVVSINLVSKRWSFFNLANKKYVAYIFGANSSRQNFTGCVKCLLLAVHTATSYCEQHHIKRSNDKKNYRESYEDRQMYDMSHNNTRLATSAMFR